jgi:hypothetical protein
MCWQLRGKAWRAGAQPRSAGMRAFAGAAAVRDAYAWRVYRLTRAGR